MYQARTSALIALLLYPALFRALPYLLSRFGMDIGAEGNAWLWGLTPVLAFGLFSTAHLKNRTQGVLLPLCGWLLGDLLIRAARQDWGFFYPGWYWTYLGFLAVCVSGFCLRKGYNRAGAVGLAASSSVAFFLISNIGFWGNFYPLTAAGLLECYVAALPFFRPMFATTILVSAVIFSPWGRRVFLFTAEPEMAPKLALESVPHSGR